MIVIVVVGVLSAVALPNFLGVRDKAKIGANIGEMVGLAKECSSAITIDGPFPEDYPDKLITDGEISGDCNNGSGKGPTTDVIFKSEAIPDELDGTVNCGPDEDEKLTTTLPVCQVTVNSGTGKIAFAAVAS